MSEKNEICIVATITTGQTFNLSENAPSDKEIIQDFEAVKFTLDPAPPCEWTHELNSVQVEVSKKSGTITRNLSLAVILNIDQSNIEAVTEMMAEEGYYDKDDGFDWFSAINYFIADTAVAPEYADFESENVDVDILEVDS